MISPKKIVAHRGWQAQYPENTLLGIQKAIDAGVLHIECDVQITADGHLVLCHDIDLTKLAGVEVLLSQTKLATLLGLSCYEPERLGEQFISEKFASLAQLLPIISSYSDVTFYIELKKEAINQAGLSTCLLALKTCLNNFDNVILISFHDESLIQARQLYGFNRTGLVLCDWDNRNQVIQEAGVEIAYISKHHLPKEGVLTALAPLAVYEVGVLSEAMELLARGASFIESFCSPDLIGDEPQP